jgi:hypothetical protein
MAAGQDWCLQCGAGAPGSLSDPGWRSAGAVLGVVALLVLGAAVAGYAALNRSPKKGAVVTRTVAAVPVTPAATTPATPATPGTAAAKAAIPATPVKPPKIPLTVPTPKAAKPTTTTATPTTPASKTTTTPATATPTTPAKSEAGGAGEESKPAALVLDTDAASTYNPYNLPAFGDPSLTIDGDSSTAWTAQVNPATAPAMAEGVLLDLRIPQKIASVELITSTPGLTIQIYGANGASAPSSITAPGWTRLTHSITVHKRHVHLNLLESKHGFSWVTLWISKAPQASVGTPQEPGHVSINEVELFPPSS